MTPVGKEEQSTSDDLIQSVDIIAFINIQKIPAQYLGVSYQLRPLQGDEAQYSHLRKTLSKTCNIAIVQVKWKKQRHIAALIPFENSLRLHILHWENQPASQEQSCSSSDGDIQEHGVLGHRLQYSCSSQLKEISTRNVMRHSDGISNGTRHMRRYSRIRPRLRG